MAYPSESRSASFEQGNSGGDPVSTTVQSNVDPAYHPTGMNQQLVRTPSNGNGPQDAERQLMSGGETVNSNGMSESTFTKKRPLLSTGLGVG
jgi:hypothetical protein